MDLAFGADSDSLDRVIDTHIKNLGKSSKQIPEIRSM